MSIVKSTLEDSTPASRARRLQSLRIEIALLERMISLEDISRWTGQKLGTIMNIISGSAESQLGRKKITNAVGFQLWAGVKPEIRKTDGELFSQAELQYYDEQLLIIEALLFTGASESDLEGSRDSILEYDDFPRTVRLQKLGRL